MGHFGGKHTGEKTGGNKMAALMKDKRHPHNYANDDTTHQGESAENCELCGQKMEHGPVSEVYPISRWE